MEEYKGNSHRDRQRASRPEVRKDDVPEKRVEKAVTTTVSVQKKNQISRLSEVFFAKDIRSVVTYMKDEWLIPNLRQAAWALFANSLHMMLFGEPDRENRNRTNASRVSYWQPNINRLMDRRDDRREPIRTRKDAYSYDDIMFTNRGDAELALDKMFELLQRYNIVRVADLFELVDQTCSSTDYAYGWTDLSSVKAVAVAGGKWMLTMPRAMPLD